MIRLWFNAALVIAGFCLTGVVFIFGYDALTQCDYFRAETITITGSSRLSKKAILEATELEYGENILAVNLVRVRKRLMAEPWIKNADIRREFPSRLIIRVNEHEPLAVLDIGLCFLVDETGGIFKEAFPSEMGGIPIISGIGYRDWKRPGNSETKIYSAVISALDVIQKRRDVFSDRPVYELSVDHEMGLTFQTGGSVEAVHLGYGDYAKKIQRIARIFPRIEADNSIPEIKRLDAHNPDRIIATPTARDTSEEEKEV